MRGVSRVLGFSLLLVSMAPAAWGWGQIGHRASAYVAEAFLTPQSKQAIQQLIGKQRLADISTWADTLRGDDTLKHISPYHYEGIREGVAYLDHLRRLPHDEIARGGVLQAILVSERQMEDPKIPMKQKEIALRFLVHFIGDIHQPLHSGRPEDKGGNAIRVRWFGFDGSLHSIWDTGMILSGHDDIFGRRENANVDQSLVYARKLLETHRGLMQPRATRDNPEAWLMESVQARVPAYDQDYKNNPVAYQQRNLPTVDGRVYAAGLRIADVLNRIFANVAPPDSQTMLVKNIESLIGKLENVITLGPRKPAGPSQEYWH